MKYSNKRRRLQGRIEAWEKNPAIQKANQQHPGSFKKPGSINK